MQIGIRSLGYLVLVLGGMSQPAFASITLSPAQAHSIGNKIWYNESRNSIEKLTWWKSGEQWASLGIGHFIWYPRGYNGIYTETFPDLLIYLHAHKVALPTWLYDKSPQPCPWSTQEAFMTDFKSPKMIELRTLLANTIDLQTQFIIERFNANMSALYALCTPHQLAHVKQQFKRVTATPQGVYAVIDYANFKGLGTSQQERYNGQGWGLLQVLEAMHDTQKSSDAVAEFVQAAKQVLERRVKNAPAQRNEGRWLAGWCNRIDGYTHH
jgi:hypothetical protein